MKDIEEIELLIDDLNKLLKDKSEILRNDNSAYTLPQINIRKKYIKGFEKSYKESIENSDLTLRAQIISGFKKRYYEIKRYIEDIKHTKLQLLERIIELTDEGNERALREFLQRRDEEDIIFVATVMHGGRQWQTHEERYDFQKLSEHLRPDGVDNLKRQIGDKEMSSLSDYLREGIALYAAEIGG